jgi:predicted glycoside hydrolase/deacetylase ChbG (UPF0249 family)
LLIVNADDFGRTREVNRAIVECFARGVCTSTTIMANMPGFPEACALAGEGKFLEKVGLHLVLNEGRPVTREILPFRKFCTEEGEFAFSRGSRVFSLEAKEKRALAAEIRGQIRRCRDRGVRISHIDSHHHVHMEWGVLNVLVPVAKEEKIPFLRISRNMSRSTPPLRKVYKSLLNATLKFRGISATDYFGTFEEYRWFRSGHDMAGKVTEIMIHPDSRGDRIYAYGTTTLGEFAERMKELPESGRTTSFHELHAGSRA